MKAAHAHHFKARCSELAPDLTVVVLDLAKGWDEDFAVQVVMPSGMVRTFYGSPRDAWAFLSGWTAPALID